MRGKRKEKKSENERNPKAQNKDEIKYYIGNKVTMLAYLAL